MTDEQILEATRPTRRYQLVIKIEADTLPGVIECIDRIEDQVSDGVRGPVTNGGCDVGYYWDMREDQSMTPARYREEVHMWVERLRRTREDRH